MTSFKKGFTLIELLVVVAIIGLLATLAIISFGTARTKARDAKRLADIKSLQSALELFNNDNAGYPTGAARVLGTGTSVRLCSTEGFVDVAPAACGTSIMAGVPKDPGTDSYTYNAAAVAPSEVAATYKIDFKLEKPNGNLLAGANCATPSGLQPSVCP